MVTIKETLMGVSSATENIVSDFSNKFNNSKRIIEEKKKSNCEAQGGVWDGVKCILPSKKKETKTQDINTKDINAPEEKSISQVMKDAETGKLTGITTPSGQTLLNLSPTEVRELAAKYSEQTEIPAGFVSAEEEGALRAKKAQSMQALSQLGLTPEQILQIEAQVNEADIDWGQAITAGLANVLPSTVGGAVGGATVGLIGGPASPITSTVGAVLGGTGGFVTSLFSGIRNNIKSQQSGEIASTQKVLTNAKANLRQIRMLAQADPSKADEAVELYNQQMATVYQAQKKLKLEVQGNLNSFMEDGTEKLVEFDLFLMQGGYADLQRQRLQEALIGGVPLTPEQIILELQQDMEQEIE